MIGPLLAGFATNPWMRTALRYGAIALAVLLFLLALRRSGERAGRLAERLETTERSHDAKRRMLEAAARRPRSRDDLAERLRPSKRWSHGEDISEIGARSAWITYSMIGDHSAVHLRASTAIHWVAPKIGRSAETLKRRRVNSVHATIRRTSHPGVPSTM